MANADQRAPLTYSPTLEPLPGCHIEQLPLELITTILELLDPDDLRSAAAVSRLWYALAWGAGHSIRACIACSRFKPGSKPAVLAEIVQHALCHNRPLSLSLTLIDFDNTHWRAFQAIVSSLTASLPVLAYLSVSISRHAVPNIVSALLRPAPNLREFVFLLEQPTGPCQFELPAEIFGAVAPKLRRLVLDRIPVGQTLVPAFARVNTLQLECSYRFPDIDFAAQFPCLLDLHLSFYTTIGGVMPDSFRFAGLRLRRLVIEDYDHHTIVRATLRSIDISQIPVFEHIGTQLRPDGPLWTEQDLGALSLRLGLSIVHRSKVSVLVMPSHRRWRRAHHIQAQGRDEQTPIVALPGVLRVGQCVTYLHIDNGRLIELLEAGWPDLAALRALRIDCERFGTRPLVLWPPWQKVPAPEHRRYVRCPALETLTLALTVGASDSAATLASRDVARLGIALAQCERGAQERAALVLVGIDLDEPADEELLQTFSSIRCCAPGSLLDRDGRVWNDE